VRQRLEKKGMAAVKLTGGAEEGGAWGNGEVRPAGRSRAGARLRRCRRTGAGAVMLRGVASSSSSFSSSSSGAATVAVENPRRLGFAAVAAAAGLYMGR
jgi:hypothetical protein